MVARERIPSIVVGALCVILVVAFATYTPKSPLTPSATASTNSELVTIPGLTGVVYKLGSADRFAAYAKSPNVACAQWKKLPEMQKRGLAFVDAKVVPKCANPSYTVRAGTEHTARPQQQTYNDTTYVDLGSPAVPDSYTGQTYSCEYLKKLTGYLYVAPKVPDYATVENLEGVDPASLTMAQKHQLDQFNQAENANANYEVKVLSPIEQLYQAGGNFDGGCYPPGAVFGRNGSITFYPSHPVSSIRESAVPVFFSHSGSKGANSSNLGHVGIPYVIQPGDSPSSVAAAFYNFDGWSEWPLIVAANDLSVPVPDPNSYSGFRLDLTKFKWVVGMIIYVPVSP